MKNLIATSLFALATTVSFSAQAADDMQGGPGGKPPAEAFEACADKSENDSCSASTERGEMSGTCMAPPKGDGELACVPENGGKGGEDRPPRS